MDKDRAAEKALLKKYGLTLKDYEEQLAKQGGVCAICGRPPKNRRLNVDHRHSDGALRGLLCYFCNKFILGRGFVTAEMHRKAAEYLDNPPWDERYIPNGKMKKRVKAKKTRKVRTRPKR